MEKNNQCLGSSSYIHSNFCKSPCFLHLEIVRHGTHIDFRLVKQFCNFPLSVLRESVQRLISKQETKKLPNRSDCETWTLDYGLHWSCWEKFYAILRLFQKGIENRIEGRKKYACRGEKFRLLVTWCWLKLTFDSRKKGRYFGRDITSRGDNTFKHIILQLL